ncbi:hypothetical protein B7494_g812 [Chlorociboria aeruginascens]|nr:hypothetical protein B7494_g812 [Chlorociboria aeruginascens]
MVESEATPVDTAPKLDERAPSDAIDVGKGESEKDGSNIVEVQDQTIQQEKSEGATHGSQALQPTKSTVSDVPYSSFTLWQKRFIVFTATMGSFFSPFSTQIYFPALNTIAKALNVSDSKINLTMTTYMIFQAIAPAFIGGFSDSAGRRIAFVVCFIIYIAADIGLAIQSNYTALLVLRMVQSAGSSGTVALANAVVADIATSAERGVYIGITSLPGILAPSLGPLFGGLLSQYAGWHWIFWFLTILGVAFFIPMLLFFPETCRRIVNDGTIPPPRYARSLTTYLNERKRRKAGIAPDYAKRDELAKERPLRFPNPLATLVILADKEAALVLFYAGIVYAGFYAILSGMPSQFKAIYGYNDLVVGLMYLPLSGGSFIAAFTQGKIIDWVYRNEAKKAGIEVKKGRQQDLSNFPIEKTRLQIALPMILLSAIVTIAYGWVMHAQTSVAAPIVLLVLLGYSLIASTQTISILIVDVNPGQAGSATAAFNLVRCLLGAAATALIVPMTDAMGLGWSYTLIGLIFVALSPMLLVVMKFGPQWRKAKKAKEDLTKEKEKKKQRQENV